MKKFVSLFLLILLASCSTTSRKNEKVFTFPGLSHPVRVYYDHYMIPHIYGENIYDVVKVQGYISARERLFIMDVFRRMAMGRLSELLGDFAGITPSLDAFIRAIFTAPDGEKVYDLLLKQMENSSDPDDEMTLKFFRSFVEGINLYLRRLKNGENLYFPPEYKLFEIKPSDIPYWEVRDILAVARLFTFTLSETFDSEFENTIWYTSLKDRDPEFLMALLDPRPVDRSVTLPFFLQNHWSLAPGSYFPTFYNFLSENKKYPQVSPDRLLPIFNLLKDLREMFFRSLKDWGSNNFVVSGEKSKTGYAYLANDPHLQLMTPPIFYEFHLMWNGKEGKGNVAGVTFSGTPGVIVGHNEKIAWGVTVVGYDVSDIYAEEITESSGKLFSCDDLNRNHVCEKNEYVVPVSIFTDRIKIRNYPEEGFTEEKISIPYIARHGPVIFLDNIPSAVGLFISIPSGGAGSLKAVSLKWTGMQPSNEAKAFFLLDRAENFEDFKRAVDNFEVGAQNFVYADVDGHIGYYPHAYVPIRPRGCIPWMIMDGTGWCEWKGRIPDDQLPQVTTPEDISLYEERGFICTANNDQIGETTGWNAFSFAKYVSSPCTYPYRYYLYYQDDIGFREGRITQLLEEGLKNNLIDFDYVKRVQSDNFSLFGKYFLSHLLKYVENDEAKRKIDSLDPRVSAQLKQALYYLKNWHFTTPTATSDPFGVRQFSDDQIRESVVATLFHVWVKRFIKDTISDECNFYNIPCPGNEKGAQVVYYLLTATSVTDSPTYDPSLGYSRVFDDLYTTGVTEDITDIAIRSLIETLSFLKSKFSTTDLEYYRWGALHQAIFLNPFIFKTRGPYPNDGGDFTVDVGDTPAGGENFLQTHGPAMRFVVELKKGRVRAENVLPGFNSGYYENDERFDQMPLWLHNEYREMPFYPDEVEKNALKVAVYSPGN